MSPSAGQMLIDQITPRLRSAIPRVLHLFGAEDHEELLQDSIAIAAQMLHRVESAGKDVTPGNITHYVILFMKSGRRSQSSSRADFMAPGTQLDQKCTVQSLEDQVGYDHDSDEPVTLGEILATDREDPSTLEARNVGWEEFTRSHDPRYGTLLQGIAEGRSIRESGGSAWSGYQLRRKLAGELRDYLGADAIPDSVRSPVWRNNLTAHREKLACRYAQ